MSATDTGYNNYRRGPTTVLLSLVCADCGETLEHGDSVKIYGNGKIYGTACHGPRKEVMESRKERGLNVKTGRPVKTAAAPRKKTRGKGKKTKNPLEGIDAATLQALVDSLQDND